MLVDFRAMFVMTIVVLVAGTGWAQDPQDKKDQQNKKSAAELMQEAAEAREKGKLAEAAELGIQALKLAPENQRYLVMMAQVCTEYGVQLAATDRKKANEPLRQGAKCMRKLVKVKKELNGQEKQLLGVTIYNEACCYAIDGEKEKAFKFLREAIEAGFSQTNVLENDTDFESIKDTDEFKKIVKELKDKTDG